MSRTISRSSAVAVIFILVFSVSCLNNRNDNSESDYLCISLNNYFQEVTRLIQSGSEIPDEIDSLYGMSWIEGYVIDNEYKDIIIVGKCIPLRPTYHTEDLFINFQNVFDSTVYPLCSLDPIPQNILKMQQCLGNLSGDFETAVKCAQEAIGGQRIVIGGVPRNSRHAKIMIFADYDMKKMSQGLLTDAGIRSCLDFYAGDTLNRNRTNEIGSTMSRFWFHIKENEGERIYPNYIENEGIVFIDECPVVVLTEKQIADAEGNLQDNAEEVDESAESFAAEMSDKFSDLAVRSSIFAELENLYRLQACFRAMKLKKAVEISGCDLNFVSSLSLKTGVNDLPEALPGLINYKVSEKTTYKENREYREQRLYLVAGGVSQEMSVSESNLSYKKSLAGSGEIVIIERPKRESIYWTASFSK